GTADGPLDRGLDVGVDRRLRRLRLLALEALELLDDLAATVDDLDGDRGRPGQLALVRGLEPAQADVVAGTVGLAQFLQPFGGDLTEGADHVGGEVRRGPAPQRRVPEPGARQWVDDVLDGGVGRDVDRGDGDEAVGLDAGGAGPRRGLRGVGAERRLEGRLQA